MVEFHIFANFLIAIGVGALIGFEREIAQAHSLTKEFAGIRTFVLIALLGALAGHIAETLQFPAFLLTAFAGFILVVIAGYIISSLRYKKVGATTEIAALLVFLLGVMITIGFTTYAVIFAILIAVVLATRPFFRGLAKKVDREEIFATLELAVISLVILPFLSNQNFTPADIPFLATILNSFSSLSPEIIAQLNIFNPYKIWLLVVFISAISFTGYILIKLIGTDKGIVMTGFLGGLVSSTAVTTSFAAESNRTPAASRALVLGVVVASTVMFLRVLFEVLVINYTLLPYLLLPLGIMALTGFGAVLFLWRTEKKDHQKHVEFKSPFALMPALKFGLFFVLVLFFSKLFQLLYGSKGIYIASLLSGLVDVDAITLSMSSLSLTGDISAAVAVLAITIAVSSNTIVKGAIAYFFGAKEFGLAIIKIFGIILLLGLLSTLFI